MSRVGYALIFFFSLSFVACTSNQRKTPEIKEYFVTNIEENGSKLFSYTVTMAAPEEKRRGMQSGRIGMRGGTGGGGMRGGMGGMGGMGNGSMRGGGMRGGGKGGGGMMDNAKPNREAMRKRAKEIVYEKLKTKLDETGYCRESYIELDNSFVRGRSQIRGECKDRATTEDRMTFVNEH